MLANRVGWNCPVCGGTDVYLYPNQEQADNSLRLHIEARHPKYAKEVKL